MPSSTPFPVLIRELTTRDMYLALQPRSVQIQVAGKWRQGCPRSGGQQSTCAHLALGETSEASRLAESRPGCEHGSPTMCAEHHRRRSMDECKMSFMATGSLVRSW